MGSKNHVEVHVSELCAVVTRNVSRGAAVAMGNLFPSEQRKLELISTMYPGFNPSLGSLKVFEASPEMIEAETQRREKLLADLQSSDETIEIKAVDGDGKKTISNADLFMVAREIYNGKSQPKYGLIGGYRRVLTAPEWMTAAKKFGAENDGKVLIEVTGLREGEDDAAIFEECVKENAWKLVGAEKPSDLDEIYAAHQLVELGATEKKLQEIFRTRAKAQKYYAFCECNKLYPQLNLFERIILGDDNDDSIKFSSCDKETMRKLCREGEKGTIDVIEPTEVQHKAAVDYFSDVKANKDPRIASKTEIKAGTNTPVGIVAMVFQAILDNHRPDRVNIEGLLRRVNPHADAINEFIKSLGV